MHIATPQISKRKPNPHSLAAVLGMPSRDAFTPLLGALSLTKDSRFTSSLASSTGTLTSPTTPASRHGTSHSRSYTSNSRPHTTSSNPNSPNRPRRTSIDLTATSNNVPLMSLHNAYTRKKVKRSKKLIEELRLAHRPPVEYKPDVTEPDYVPSPIKLDQPSPRSTNEAWDPGFTRLVDTFYDSDLDQTDKYRLKRHEDDEGGTYRGKSIAVLAARNPNPQNATAAEQPTFDEGSIATDSIASHQTLAEAIDHIIEGKHMSATAQMAIVKQTMSKKERLHYIDKNHAKTLFAAANRMVHTVAAITPLNAVTEHGKHEEHDEEDPRDIIKMYLKEILNRGRAPLTLVLKQGNIRSLNLTGMGAGDDYGEAVSFCLPQLQHLSELLLSDNRLTDKSITPLLEGAQKMRGLVKLDLSKNDMDERGSEALRVLLTSPTCVLEDLNLEATDVDDEECVMLAEALCTNATVRHLNLSSNLIGKSELLNACMPELETGPEALAEMLKVNKTIISLNLSWNSIRGDSAVTLAASLAHTTTLTFLNLGQNSLSCAGSQEIGRALFANTSVTNLDLSYNQVSIKGAMVIASALKVNNTLTNIRLDGNVVGRLGSECLVSALRENASADKHTSLSLVECDCVVEDKSIFDPQFPTKPAPDAPMDLKRNPPYLLNLSLPYGYMVAKELLRLANSKDGCKFISITHQLPPRSVSSGKKTQTRPSKPVKVKLERSKEEVTDYDKMAPWKRLAASINERLDEGFDPNILETAMSSCGLNPSPEIVDWIIGKIHDKMDSSRTLQMDEDKCWEVVLQSVFEYVDEDGSGELDVDEMLHCLAEIGVTPSREVVTQVVAEYDVDDTGQIEEAEFVMYMLAKYASEAPRDKPDLVESKTGEEWEIPMEGTLTCEFEGVPSPPTADQIGTAHGVENLIKNIEGALDEEERRKIFQVATRDSNIFLTAEHAQKLVYRCKHGYSKFEAIGMLLPQMSSSQEAVRLIETNMSWKEKLKLRINMGQGWKPVMGMLSGHYDLDFSDRHDRIAAKKLSEQATLEMRFSKEQSGRKDSSQSGNWENYRNGTIDGARKVVNSSFFNRPSTVGIVRFDYVCTSRPKKGASCMGEGKFQKLLELVDLGKFDEEPEFWKENINEMVIREHWKGWQMTTHRQFMLDRAAAERRRLDEVAALKAAKKDGGGGKKGKKGKKKGKKKAEAEPVLEGEGEEEEDPLGPMPQEVLDRTHFFLIFGEREKERRVLYKFSDWGDGPNNRYRGFYCALLAVETALAGKTLSAKQAWRLIEQFPPEEDGIRVEVCGVLFPRVVDVENFCVEVSDKLTLLEKREVVWRVGNSNLFNPLNCDRKYWMDLTQFDDRQLLVNLIKLEAIEQGLNLRKVQYRRYWSTDVVDGIGVPKEWSEDEELIPRDCGEVELMYRTGGRKAQLAGGGEEESLEDLSLAEETRGEESEGDGGLGAEMSAAQMASSSRPTIRALGAAGMAEELGSNANMEFRAEMFRECFCGTKSVY